MADVAVIDSPEQEVATCRHHWVIAAPEGATSMGHCKVCGEVREFRNSSGDSLWERDGDGGNASWNRTVKPVAVPAGGDEGF